MRPGTNEGIIASQLLAEDHDHDHEKATQTMWKISKVFTNTTRDIPRSHHQMK